MDGGNRRAVLSSFETLHHPWSLTTFEDRLYWSDLNRTHVFSADKFTGERVESVAPLGFRQVTLMTEAAGRQTGRKISTCRHQG